MRRHVPGKGGEEERPRSDLERLNGSRWASGVRGALRENGTRLGLLPALPSAFPVAASAPVSAYGLPGPLRSIIEGFQERRARTTADKSLALRLKDTMAREGSAARGLSFYIEHGAVAIYGNVASGAEREAILSLVARQPGVTRIVDHLRLAPSA